MTGVAAETDMAAKIPPKDPKETAISLKGLPASATEATLTAMYGAYGKLLRVKLDKHGGAHVVFASTRAAQRAAATTNGAVVGGQKITAESVRTFEKTTRPCRSFQVGKCRKGDACKYWHPPTDVQAPTPTKPTPTKPTPTIPPTVKSKSLAAKTPTNSTNTTPTAGDEDISNIPKNVICRNFAKGKCLHGAACHYAHVLGAGPLPPAAPASIPAQCSFFLAGKCQRGDDCVFLHTDAPSLPPASKPTQCAFFAAGRCARGDACAYLHETKPGVVAKAPAAAVAAPVKAKPVEKKKHEKVVAAKPAKKPTAAAPVQTTAAEDDDNRTCMECELQDVATWVCVGCGNAKYCDDCNIMVHTPKVMRSHERNQLPPVVQAAPPSPCGECETNDAITQCGDCDVLYCGACDASVHKFKSLRNHTRTPLATGPTPSVVVVKNSTKMPVEVQAKEPVSAKKATKPVYVDSVPQFDLTSASESSSDEEEEEEQQPTQTQEEESSNSSSSSSEDEEEEDDEEANPAAAALASAYVQSVPQYELSSGSESSDDDEEEEETTAPVPAATQPKAVAAAPVVSKRVTQAEDVSSESSDDDFEDERPVVAKKPIVAVVAKKQLPAPYVVTEISSESESDSDSENKTTRAAPTPAPAAAIKKRKAASSSSDSESDSSDEELHTPVAKQPRVVAAPPAPKPTRPSASAVPAAAKVGISTGSSHSLVKKLEAYEASDSNDVLHLDPNLNGFERLLAHDCAERLGLSHISVGEGLDRHITVSRKANNNSNKRATETTAESALKKKAKRS